MNKLQKSVIANRAMAGISAVLITLFILGWTRTTQAQICFHGGALAQNVFGTNCLGQLVVGKAHPGETVCVFLRVTMNDDCAGDQTLVTNITDTVNLGCTNFTTGNLVATPFLLTFFGQFRNITNTADGCAYKYVVPECAADTIIHTSVELARDTNSISNMGGEIRGGGSAQLQVLRPRICVGKTSCVGGTGETGLITWTGSVTNCGNTVLTNVIVRNFFNNTSEVVLGPTNMNPGQIINFGGSYRPLNPCAPAVDTLVAQGTDELICTVFSTNSASCSLTLNPCLTVTKNCDRQTSIGQPVNISGVVSNCGNVTLTNIVVVDLIGTATTPITNIASLAPGASRSYASSYVPAECSTNVDTIRVTATDICGRSNLTASASCTNVVVCQPDICVTKDVACLLPNETCDVFGDEATGVKGDNQEPAFCYRITLTNCGREKLVDVVVLDNQLGDLTTNFFGAGVPAGMLEVGASITRFFKADWDQDTTNRVEAIGTGNVTRIRTNDVDIAIARILEARIICRSQIFVDGVLVNCGSSIDDGNAHQVTFRTIVCNAGQADLTEVTITDSVLGGVGCSLPTAFDLAAGACATNDCTITYSCATTPAGLRYTTTITAVVETNGVCAFDIDGNRITVTTTCTCSIECVQPAACRTTGGGRQDAPLACPDNVRYVTHGGQLGAPVGERTCTIDTTLPNWRLGNPCIHGRWTHVRHMKGGLRGNFHSRFYDTLDCACLDTEMDANGVYGPGTKVGELCNPGDRVAGPEPRKAPANKIVFTGVGDWADPNGRRAGRACLFRVDLEDRSEPGGSHPKGGTPPADRYRIRIWVLTDSELAALNEGDGLLAMRNAISACNGINVRDGVNIPNSCGPNGVRVFGVRPPDIDDGGELERGNHQIHPSIKDCDPSNPTGPGLPKP